MAELIKALVDKNRENVVRRLPKYMSPEQFLQLCYALDRNPKLSAVAQRNPDSLLNAILKAADCGLVIGSAYDHCTLIPYGDDVQLSIGYRGLIYQLFRAGAIIKATANCVYEGDDFTIELGDDEQLHHRPNLTDARRNDPKWLFSKANIKGAYAVAWLPLAPLKHHRWVPLGEVERARLNSKIPEGPAWTHHYPAMACKTAVRRLCKLIEVCGETPENREAWERYGRTVEYENAEYRRIEDDDEQAQPDDLPGAKAGKLNPMSGAAADSEGTEKPAPTPPPPSESRNSRRSVAPAPPPPKPPEPDNPISDEQQDELVELASMAGMRTSALKKHVTEVFGVADTALLSSKQADQLMSDLKKRAK
jgi:recombination protein RecT